MEKKLWLNEYNFTIIQIIQIYNQFENYNKCMYMQFTHFKFFFFNLICKMKIKSHENKNPNLTLIS